jgi:Type I phosphodiesterase / nucleotide pyrophosphatase
MRPLRSWDRFRRRERSLNSGTKFAAMAGVAALAIATPLAPFSSSAVAAGQTQIKHVLLISVDGMHQSDLEWYVARHPNSELARLATGGAEYTNAQTSDPSDSDPGGTALMTGGDPKVTGIYYDDEYSHDVFPPGTTNCSGAVLSAGLSASWKTSLYPFGFFAQIASTANSAVDVPVLLTLASQPALSIGSDVLTVRSGPK